MLEKERLNPERWYIERVALEKVEEENHTEAEKPFQRDSSQGGSISKKSKWTFFSAIKDKAKQFFSDTDS